jgi:hypothetical protein
MTARTAFSQIEAAVGGLSQARQDLPAWRPEAAEAEALPHGFRVARDEDLAEAHAFSEAIMGMPLTPLSVLWGAHEHTTATAWIYATDGRITGVIMTLPLTPEGEADLLEGRFTPASPQPHQLCTPGDPFPAIYFWLFAGGDGRSRRAILRASLAWRNGAYASVRGYARAASPAGKEALKGLGFAPIKSLLSDLFFIAERS